MPKFKPGDPFAAIPSGDPQTAPPIEDQLLEAIVSAFFPAAPASDGSSHPKSEIPNPKSLAAQLGISISKVLDLLASPRTRSQLAVAQELRDLEFHQREQRARDKALTALESILDTTEDPIEKRRAATAILGRRANRNPFWPRTPGSGAATSIDDEDLDEDIDDTPPRAPLPSPEHPKFCRPPQQTAIHLLTRLQDNHNPQPNAGLTTLFQHKTESATLCGDELRGAIDDYLDNPGEESNLTGFSAAILHPREPVPPGTPLTPRSPDPGKPAPHHPVIERITLHWPSHHRTIRFHFINNGNTIVELWQIAKVEIGPAQSHDSS